MQLNNISLSLAIASFAGSAQAVVITETFDGGLNPSLWDGAPLIENSGAISPVNDRLEFTAGPADSLIKSNHFGTYNASSVLSGDNDWCVDIMAYLAPTSDFGTFGLNEATALTLSIENTNNSQDSLEVSFAAGDPLATGTADKLIRVGIKNDGVDETPTFSGLLGSIGTTDLKLTHDSTTNQILVTFDDGTGPILLATEDITGWDFDSGKNLSLSLGGAAFSTDTTIESGTFEVESGEAYFDNLVINPDTSIPEPSTVLLGAIGLLSVLRRRR